MEKEEKGIGKDKEEKKVYHRGCLSCSKCSKSVLGKFFTIGGDVVCHPCAKIEVTITLLVMYFEIVVCRVDMMLVMSVERK